MRLLAYTNTVGNQELVIYLISKFRRVQYVVFTYLPMKMKQSVANHRHIKFRRREITTEENVQQLVM
jgi:hypothetical protein